MSNENQKPARTLRDGATKAVIWKRENSDKSSFYAVSFSKTYRDEKGEYQNASSFTGTDLLKLSMLAKEAYQVSRELYYQDRQNARTENNNTRQRSDRER